MKSYKNRKLHIKKGDYHYLDEGAYGVILKSNDCGKVIKLLHTNNSKDQCCKVFEAEVEAYEIAAASNELKDLVPIFYGQKKIEEILDSEGTNIINEFYGSLAFEVEFISGNFIKIGKIQPDEKRRISKLFSKEGIMHTNDASVLLKDNKVIKVIDFSKEEHQLSWS